MFISRNDISYRLYICSHKLLLATKISLKRVSYIMHSKTIVCPVFLKYFGHLQNSSGCSKSREQKKHVQKFHEDSMEC